MNRLVYLVLISSFTLGMSRNELRSRYQDDQHQWLAPVQQNVCGICLSAEGRIKSLSCHKTHRFHSACIEQWRAQKSECPVCRAQIVDSIWCTCLKSLAKPGVVTLFLFAGASAVKTIQECNTIEPFFSASCENQCSVCVQLSISAACALCSGFRLYQINHPKDD